MALDRFNIEIEGLEYKEYNSDLYCQINLYDLIEHKVSVPIITPSHTGLILLCDAAIGDNRYFFNRTPTDYSKMDKLIIPEHIKYLKLHLDLEHYTNVIITHELEYIEMHLSMYEVDMNKNLFYNFIKKISQFTNMKSLCIILNYDLTSFLNKRLEPDLPQIETYYIEYDHETHSQVINFINELLPRKLEYLHVNFIIPNINEFTSLKTFKISREGSYKAPLDNLPASLEWLEIHAHDFNHPLNNLPNNMKVLIFNQFRLFNYYDGYKHSLNNLPLSLEVLVMPETDMMDGTTSKEICDNLPVRLRYLSVPKYVNNLEWDALPDSLEVLEALTILSQMNMQDIKVNKLPSSLIEVIISKYDIEDKEMIDNIKIFKDKNCKITSSDKGVL